MGFHYHLGQACRCGTEADTGLFGGYKILLSLETASDVVPSGVDTCLDLDAGLVDSYSCSGPFDFVEYMVYAQEFGGIDLHLSTVLLTPEDTAFRPAGLHSAREAANYIRAVMLSSPSD